MTKQTRGTTAAQDQNIIKIIKTQAPRLRLCGEYYPHYSQPLGKWSAGFEIVKLENGKPQTINKAARAGVINYLFIFTGMTHRYGDPIRATIWNGTRAAACKINGSRAIHSAYTCTDAEDYRKQGRAFFLVSVPALYDENDTNKQEERRNNRPNKTTAQRLKGAQICKGEEHEQRGERYEQTAKQWGRCASYFLDASGYDLTTQRHTLHRRARELEKARKLERWNNQDHTETAAQLKRWAGELLTLAVDIFKSSADFYPQHMAQDLRECAAYIETTAQQIESQTATDAEQIAHRVEHSAKLWKKCRILAPLAADPCAYGWTWWELTPAGELVNTYERAKRSGKYYDRITCDSVGIMETTQEEAQQ